MEVYILDCFISVPLFYWYDLLLVYIPALYCDTHLTVINCNIKIVWIGGELFIRNIFRIHGDILVQAPFENGPPPFFQWV